MRLKHLTFALLAALVSALPAGAHHPGADLDAVMGSKERFFQPVDRLAPPFTLRDAVGKAVTLADLSDKIVVLHFVYAACPDVCPLHAEKLAEVQAMINETPMKDRIQFISVTTDPASDTPDVLKAYGPEHGLDPSNWTFLTVGPDEDESTTRALAVAFGHKFVKTDDGFQTHGVVTHIIDRGGRWAANFHGLRFAAVNMVLYLNGLTNMPPAKAPEPGWWDKLKSRF